MASAIQRLITPKPLEQMDWNRGFSCGFIDNLLLRDPATAGKRYDSITLEPTAALMTDVWTSVGCW